MYNITNKGLFFKPFSFIIYTVNRKNERKLAMKNTLKKLFGALAFLTLLSAPAGENLFDSAKIQSLVPVNPLEPRQ